MVVLSPTYQIAVRVAGWCLLGLMALWIGSTMSYDYWLAATSPKQPDPSTFHTVREHSFYITPSQQSVLLMPLMAGWVVGGVGLLCLKMSGHDFSKQNRRNYWLSAVMVIVVYAASYNPYAANVASFLGSGRWTLSR